jgi:hypothetical protein
MRPRRDWAQKKRNAECSKTEREARIFNFKPRVQLAPPPGCEVKNQDAKAAAFAFMDFFGEDCWSVAVIKVFSFFLSASTPLHVFS